MGLDGESLRWLKRGALLAILLLLAALIIAIPRLGEAQDGGPDAPLGFTPPEPRFDPPPDLLEPAGEGLVAAAAGNAYIIPPSEFVDFGGSMNYELFGYLSPDGGAECQPAPVYVPDGVTISKLSMWAYDNYNDAYVYTALLRQPYKTTAGASLLKDIWTDWTGTSTSMQYLSANVTVNNVVDNAAYYYFIYTCPFGTDDSQTRFYGAQVEYTE